MSRRPRLQHLPLGAVAPRGWLREQALVDLDEGLVGRLDVLTPRARAEVFAASCPAGAGPDGWWDAETYGNWLWGYAMTAHLAAHGGHVERAGRLLDALRATQDADGYLGIYGPRERFTHPDGENGELWAQGRALLPLLARHEATGNAADLHAAELAVALTMTHYGPSRSYFRIGPSRRRSAFTGLTHGLCYTDVLEQLHAITGDASYARFGAWLYDDFSAGHAPFANDDVALENLLEADRPWSGHAVHTAAHLRALLLAHAVTGRTDLATAVSHATRKLGAHALPAGALPGDESIHGVPHAESGYELCTTVELGFSLASLMEKTGTAAFGDWIEALFFNAFQGARLPDGRAVAYLSADTRLAALAGRTDAYSLARAGRRFKLSPTHDDVACCCAPNAGRALPHYVSRMWMATRGEPGLALTAYGPCRVSTTVGGVAVAVDVTTSYPFADDVDVAVSAASPVTFALWLRRPAWADRMSVEAPGAAVDEWPGWYCVRRTWTRETVALALAGGVRAVPYATGEVALMRGPLQFVVAIEPSFEPTRDYPLEGFHDYDVRPRDAAQACHVPVLDAGAPDLGARVERDASSPSRPWTHPPLRLRVGPTVLVPMGASVLRRAAFPLGAAPTARARTTDRTHAPEPGP